jgi:hypothetical protein
MSTKANNTARAEALQELHKILKPGDTLHTITRHVSSSGMSRAISVVKVGRDGSIFYLDGLVARAGIFSLHPRYDGLKLDGAGMDMGFHLVYSVSRAVFADGFKCTGHDGTKRAPACPSNDHSNYYAETRGQANPPANYSRGRKHSDPGYALRHRWM